MDELENLLGAFVLVLAKNGGSVSITEEDFKNAENRLNSDIVLEVDGNTLIVKLVTPEQESKIIKPKLEVVK